MQEPLSADGPPLYSFEAEESVLACCLVDNGRIDEAALLVGPSDFFRSTHGPVFAAILELREQGSPVDVTTLADHLGHVQYTAIGGDEALGQITDRLPHGANVAYYAGIVREKATLRETVEACADIGRDIRACQWTAAEILARAEQKIFAISERDAVGSTVNASAMMASALARLERIQRGEAAGLPTGFADLDRPVRGFQPGQLAILGARPSQGKTALALGIAWNIAADGHPVLFVSLEMSQDDIGERQLAHFTERPYGQLIDGEGSPEIERALSEAYARSHRLPIEIDHTPARTVSQIAANARRMKRRRGLGIVMIDYLGLIDGQKQKNESREEEVGRITKFLKSMARELCVPVLCLHQLNRESVGRRPKLSDLRESGQVEAHADLVMLLHRPEMEDAGARPGEADLIVAKNRNGPTGIVKLTFRKEIARFYSHGKA
jgi:replicative DNA helicase